MAHQTAKTVCFFTDQKSQKFRPLTLTRPMDDLRLGIFTIREKWMRTLQVNRYSRLLPDHLDGVFDIGTSASDEACLWVNSRFLPSQQLQGAILKLKEGEKLTFNNETIAALADKKTSAIMHKKKSFNDSYFTPIKLKEAIHLEHLWDLLPLNAYETEKDLALTQLQPLSETNISLPDVITSHPENIYIDEDADIEPGCVLIAKDGPIIIQKKATLEAGCIVRGPAVIGTGATVKMKARIYDGTTIGPVCKVGGEVANCIFHSYSNKGHDGFTGNSIFGQWVNIGADTNTSNLKNNYSPVRMADWASKEEIETEAQFLGTVMGDHSKTAINTMLNTGTICGVSSNIFMANFPPKYIPSFSWVGETDYSVYKFDKALEAMRAMMKRRDKEVTDAYAAMMEYLFKNR
ncbi:putative sugar nucleotidyl transferase [Gracilimonas mengyeensis]|uniref:UDP-N-acetylglucosamine diphosphorylase/glucosamine-1-phosphate N-acetyltransferase n=1 Tax=Gracilimonas mengyeensis TaxID=1302730 RepID=A0A521FAA5_9BACT|nr:putative sugar nucleotidyl transferase [Gracilimonas mengyeensis]SMO93108.1 UDP-N-acetylglucosamine diphosphorylase/glucosamine-1-phosphate N-acetyltransferase [Gracilimonas mengyeensis]